MYTERSEYSDYPPGVYHELLAVYCGIPSTLKVPRLQQYHTLITTSLDQGFRITTT
jgi:hypothetical protein